MKKKLKAFSVIELVLSAALFSIFSVSITLAVLQGSSAIQAGIRSEIARQFAMEGIEATRAVRAQSFDALQNTASSGIEFVDGKWELAGEQDEKDGYVRRISVQSAERDSEGNVVASGGTEDLDLKLIVVAVTKDNYSVDFSTYVSRREIVLIEP
ncbi:MAG: hypothetical protein UT50_C0002G0010 [Candidatus Moranbacteria bacterium GW2011_GWA2_39_41]|nr:MAG: hypothetical protein UT50_C0002G0010 [Candidatus Moranbacteria bacterium GW2011_GWA2_39_41]